VEEAIKILEEIINRCEKCNFATCEQCEINWTEVQAIESLIKRNKELEEENKEKAKMITDQDRNLQISYYSLQELFKLREYKNNSIQKSIIKEKIEELNKQIDLAIDNSKGGLDEEFIDKASELSVSKKTLEALLEDK
jgi:hypothetical protein